MFRSIILVSMLVWAVCLAAIPDFVPKTVIAEDFSSSSCVSCVDANAGLDVVHSQFHPGEFISARYYMQSGDLSNTDSDARAFYYEANFTPIVIFNGTQFVNGGGAEITDGSTYLSLLTPKRFTTTPVKMDIVNFNAQTGVVNARVRIVSADFTLNAQTLNFLLVENNVTTVATRVVRAVRSEPITLAGLNSYQDFTANFTISPTYNTANLWVAAFVQLDDKTIMQSASSLPQPQYQIRAAMTWGQEIIGQANQSYLSSPVWFFNTGETENFTIRIIKDDGPADWYYNFCDEEGLCYYGLVPFPFNLPSGAVIGFHLNLIIGSPGISHFRFVIESSNIPTYEIPFTYETTTANDDNFLPVIDLRILQNYPNPFSGETSFRINSKSAAQPVTIDIYNTKGQRVSSVLTTDLKAGNNEITWQALDYSGKALSPGIYFSRIREDITATTTKLLILNN